MLVFEFDVATAQQPEAAGTAQAPVRATSGSVPAGGATVGFHVVSALTTATDTADYNITGGGVLSFTAGQTTPTNITITLVSDGVAEPPEHLVLQLDAPSVGMLGTTTTFILTITDVLPGQVLSLGASAATRPGPSVALSGDTLAVGAPDATTVNGATGEVLIYTRSNVAWTGPARIPGVSAGEAFGASVALSGNVLVVGAPLHTSSVQSGAAYVFEHNGTTWEQHAVLLPPTPVAGDRFGAAVAISDVTAAVGAPDQGMMEGAVHLFRRTGPLQWPPLVTVTALHPHANDRFGAAVALETGSVFGGLTLAVGTPGDGSATTGVVANLTNEDTQTLPQFIRSGAVYVFEDNGAFNLVAYVKPANTFADMAFGTSVALHEDRLVVGAPGEMSNATGVGGPQADTNRTLSYAGATFSFTRATPGLWAAEASFKATNTGAEDRFGTSVALSGIWLVVGAPNEDGSLTVPHATLGDDGRSNSGAVYVYVLNGAIWTGLGVLKAQDSVVDGRFGTTVGASGSTAAVGAQLPGLGAAYVFQ